MKPTAIIALVMLATILVLAGCIKSTESGTSHEAAHWSYEGNTGPSHWGDLSPDYRTCKTGKNQSPIDLTGAMPVANLPELIVNYRTLPVSATMHNNTHTIQVDENTGSTLIYNGTTYRLLQYHFHNPSEHTINGEPAAMELHLVHRDDEGNYLVVGVLFEAGAENPVLAGFWDALPEEEGETTLGAEVNIADILPIDGIYEAYEGSLTTPPCTEGVHWIMMKTPVEMSQEQIDYYGSFLGGTARPVQRLNNRAIAEKAAGFVRP
ncbi:MAG: carbonic anhydrase family protein [Chloroflexaceae bacterium]|nr:carbonic anhydrase family protein [Chloroflexaceae bacterium]